MKKNKSKKSKINIIDIIIVVVLLAIAALLIYKFSSVNKSSEVNLVKTNATIEYEADIVGARIYTADSIKIGDKVYDRAKNTYIGEVVQIEINPYVQHLLNSNGELVEVTKPDYYDIKLRVKAPVTDKNSGYFLSGVLELKVNSVYSIQTKTIMSSFKVENILAGSEGK